MCRIWWTSIPRPLNSTTRLSNLTARSTMRPSCTSSWTQTKSRSSTRWRLKARHRRTRRRARRPMVSQARTQIIIQLGRRSPCRRSMLRGTNSEKRKTDSCASKAKCKKLKRSRRSQRPKSIKSRRSRTPKSRGMRPRKCSIISLRRTGKTSRRGLPRGLGAGPAAGVLLTSRCSRARKASLRSARSFRIKAVRRRMSKWDLVGPQEVFCYPRLHTIFQAQTLILLGKIASKSMLIVTSSSARGIVTMLRIFWGKTTLSLNRVVCLTR